MTNNQRHPFLIFGLIICIISSYVINIKTPKPLFKISMQEKAFNVDYKFLLIFNLGLKRLISSSLWISTLLDSDHDHYRKQDLNNWIYLRLRNIFMLEPKFLWGYQFGGVYLSVIKNDIPGAEQIYKLALENYNDDFLLNIQAGYFYYFELNDIEKSLPLFEKIMHHPKAPPYMPNLVAKLKAQSKDLKSAFALLLPIYEQTHDDSYLKNHFRKTLYTLKAKIDLKCLNSKQANCSSKDFSGNPYLIKNGEYTAQEELTELKLFRNKKAQD